MRLSRKLWRPNLEGRRLGPCACVRKIRKATLKRFALGLTVRFRVLSNTKACALRDHGSAPLLDRKKPAKRSGSSRQRNRWFAHSPLERTGFEPSVPRYRGQRLDAGMFERLITFCAVAKAVRNSNLQYRPRTFHKTCRLDRRHAMVRTVIVWAESVLVPQFLHLSGSPERTHTWACCARLTLFTWFERHRTREFADSSRATSVPIVEACGRPQPS